jgi:hypothetical protein
MIRAVKSRRRRRGDDPTGSLLCDAVGIHRLRVERGEARDRENIEDRAHAGA